MSGPGEELSPKDLLLHGRLVGPVDAIFRLNRTLAAGQSFTVTYMVRHQRLGCYQRPRWASKMPTVEDSALGLSRHSRRRCAIRVPVRRGRHLPKLLNNRHAVDHKRGKTHLAR